MSTLNPDEYLDYRSRIGPDQLLWANNGWRVRRTSGEQEMLLWVSGHLLKGFSGDPFAGADRAVNQTLPSIVDSWRMR